MLFYQNPTGTYLKLLGILRSIRWGNNALEGELMGIVYKFRSINSLLKHKELQNSELHFSSPEYLNDPMEKIKNYVFNGEEINWKCLIRTFVCDYYFKTVFDGFDDGKSIISYYKVTKQVPVPEIAKTIDYITEYILNERFIINKINEFIYNDIQADVLIDFLYTIIPLINEVINKQLNDKINSKIKETHFGIDINNFHEVIKNEKPFYIKFAENIRLQVENENIKLINKNLYPQKFVDILISYCFPPYYVLSLSSNFDSSSMWSHYANNHEGVCLMFNTDIIENNEYLNIKYFGNKQEVKKVNYCLMKPINVFTYMGAVGGGIVYCLHNYKNEKSKFWENLEPLEFVRKLDLVLVNELGLTKSPDWRNENEKRIFIRNEDNNKSINLKYDEHQFIGLIFGINTKMRDEAEIISILKKKKNLSKDFKLYKAFYNFDTDKIDKCDLNLKIK